MPRYFFDILDGGTTIDETGTMLASLEIARAQAIDVLPDIARQFPPDGHSKVFEVLLRGECGKHLFRAVLTFRCETLV